MKAARFAEQEEKSYQVADLYEKAAMQAVRMGNFPKTSELLETVTTILVKLDRFERVNRVILYRVLLKLFNEDSVAARNIFDQACHSYPAFDQWEERDHIELLIEAFDQDDKDSISQRCQVRTFALASDSPGHSFVETLFHGYWTRIRAPNETMDSTAK